MFPGTFSRNWFSIIVLLISALIWQVWRKAANRDLVPPTAATPTMEAEQVARIMLSWHELELVSLKKVQSLWAGYGHICQVTARATSPNAAIRMRETYGDDISVADERSDDETFKLILKLISPPRTSAGAKEDEGHLRKVMSYAVEQNFYTTIAPQLGRDLPLARCISATQGKPSSDIPEGITAIIMTDLRLKYPVAGEKRGELNETQVHAALDWLSEFHRRSWDILPKLPLDELLLPPLEEAEKRRRRSRSEGEETAPAPPHSVWLNGGYTYLATRRKEYASLVVDSYSEWSSALCKPFSEKKKKKKDRDQRSVAEMAARVLTPRGREHETLIHGDVKSENLFTTPSGDEVAFYDFQYVGLGLGVCDLAKLFTCSVPVSMLTTSDDGGSVEMLPMDEGEMRLLQRYRLGLLLSGDTDRTYEWDILVRHWETALVDWLRFQASWGFWGNTEWLEARVRHILQDQGWRDWLEEQDGLIED